MNRDSKLCREEVSVPSKVSRGWGKAEGPGEGRDSLGSCGAGGSPWVLLTGERSPAKQRGRHCS